MLARKCDICGKFYDFYGLDNCSKPNGITLVNNDPKGYERNLEHYDCCPECMDEIVKCIVGLGKNKKKLEE